MMMTSVSVVGATFHPGDRGDQIVAIQNALVRNGSDIAVDGDYGTGTQEAVKAFQERHGLDVDGIVGAQTYEALMGAAMPENVSSHFFLQKSRPVNDYIYKNFLNGFYKYSQYIHCPTLFIAKQLRDHGYTQDLRVISNGVDPAFTPEKKQKPEQYADKFCILSTGRLVKEKCQSELLKAAALSRHADKIQIFLAGDGPQKKKLQKLGQELKNPPVIAFHSKEDLVGIIQYCDLYVHCAYAEIESIACVEAITCGLVPVIADSKMSAAKNFAQNESDLYRAGDPADLAAKIDYMIEHPEVREQQREQYVKYAERFRIEKCIDKMEEMFSDAVDGKHREQLV